MPTLPNISVTSATLPGTPELAAKPHQRPITPPPAAPVPSQKPRSLQKDSLEFPEADPWSSPALHRGHSHTTSSPKRNGTSRVISNGVHEPVRTTSTFTTASTEPSNGSSKRPSEDAPPAAAGVWGSYDANSSNSFNNSADSTVGGDGFGGSGGGDRDRQTPNPRIRSFASAQVTGSGVEENVIITLLPEKEGMFMFQHHNYQVASPRRNSKVVRRYSDFVWLLDCLQKRYPFRQLPLLPPKRVAGMLMTQYADGWRKLILDSKWEPSRC